MKNYITIDGGTTNTRISLIIDGRAVETIKLSLGARSGIDNNDALKKAIADAPKRMFAYLPLMSLES